MFSRPLCLFLAFSSAICIPAFTYPAYAQQQPTAQVIQDVTAQVRPALVRIRVVSGEDSDGKEVKSESYGSGAIISPDGYVVTNHHVAGNALWLSCTLANRERVDARLVGTDPLTDIAIIQLDPRFAPYPIFSWGNSETVRPGDPVLALGSPLALSQSVTSGIVSNTELIMPDAQEGFLLDGENVGAFVRWIGHDAQIFPGNSGGPLVNLRGEIVGINEIALGLSGAIPGNLAREVAEQLIQKGSVARAYTGLDLQPRLRGAGESTGVLVGGVVAGSPAAKAGVKAGDVLLGFLIKDRFQPLDAKFGEQMPEVNRLLSQLPPQEAATLRLQRNVKLAAPGALELSLTPTQRPPSLAPAREVRGWGLTASDITPAMALEGRLPGTSGAYISGVTEDGPSADAKPAVQAGDVLLGVNGRAVTNLKSLQQLTAGLMEGKQKDAGAVTEIWRNGERILTVVKVGRTVEEDASTSVARPWLPVALQVVTEELARALKLPADTRGVRVTQIFPNSVAGKVLRVGDIITEVDGLEIDATQPEDTDVLPGIIRQYKVNSWAKMKIYRAAGAGKWNRQQIALQLPQEPPQERDLRVYKDQPFGLTLRNVTYLDRVRGDAPEAKDAGDGVLVLAVESGSWASLAGLAIGDVLHAIDGEPIPNLAAARRALEALAKSGSNRAVFFVTRGVHTQFVEMQTGRTGK